MPDQVSFRKNDLKKNHTQPDNRFLLIEEIIYHTPDIFELRLEREDINFTPGDCLSIYTRDGQTSREYSIASGIHETHLGFLIKHIEGGVVTDYLQKSKSGDHLEVSLPYGWFRPGLQHTGDDFIFIATGTGIAPFLSYVKSYPDKPPKKILYGVRKLNEAIHFDSLRNICPTELAISREKNKGHHHGHVTNLMNHLNIRMDTHFYLCGLDAMIDDVTVLLENKGLEPINIHHEVFFHASYFKK